MYGVPSVKDEIACNLAEIACNLAKLQISCNLAKLQISCNLAKLQISCNLAKLQITCNLAKLLQFVKLHCTVIAMATDCEMLPTKTVEKTAFETRHFAAHVPCVIVERLGLMFKC